MPRAPTKNRSAAKLTAVQRRRRPPADAALQTALAALAHEVRTPLNGILVLAELLAAADLPPKEREWAVALKVAAEHLADLTTVIVDGARADIGVLSVRRERFDAASLAQALAQSLKVRAAFKGLQVATEIAADLPAHLMGDAVLIRAAVENLIDNAVKFTERGAVRLTVSAISLPAGKQRLTFRIADEGIGMSAADLRRLFRPFARSAKAGSYRGAGLGLVFARKVARAMGGDLNAVSEPGHGASFSFTAVVDETAPAGEPMPFARKASASGGLRLLCVEDNPYGRVMLDTVATALGHSVAFATSGEAAVEAARREHYDLILMDVTLPGIDGVEATRRIRTFRDTARRNVAIIGISGRGDAAEEAAARAAGMNDYLVKPVSATALAKAVAMLEPQREQAGKSS